MNGQVQCKWRCRWELRPALLYSAWDQILCRFVMWLILTLGLYQCCDVRPSHSPCRQALQHGLCLNRKMKFPASPRCVLDPIVACYKEKAIKEPWLRDRRWSNDRCKLLLKHTAGEPIIMPMTCILTNIEIHKLKRLLFFSHVGICR